MPSPNHSTAKSLDRTRSETARESGPFLSVEGLRTDIHLKDGVLHAVDDVSFTIDRGEIVCLVGESGSGKSVTCQSLTGIVPQPPAEIVDGSVVFDGTAITELREPLQRQLRGNRIAHVFQNPQQALDPVYTIGDQITEAMTIHNSIDADAAREQAVDLLRRVGIPRAHERINDYPHEFSGGMRQRIAIAIALAAEPDLLIADEPTTAVDVTVQARLLELLGELTDDGLSVLLVTHDLRVVAALADRVLVMYGGTIVERGSTEAIFTQPSHPYTQALFESYTDDDLTVDDDPDTPASQGESGCRFHTQCPHAVDACANGSQPAFFPAGDEPSHRVSCLYFDPASEHDPTPIYERARETRPNDGGGDR